MKHLRLFLVLIALALTLCLLASCKTQDTTGTEEPGIDPSGSTGETVHIHTFGEWEVTVPSTCVKEGTQQRACECGETETMAVGLSAHTEVVDAAVSATCSSTGLTEGKHCSVCQAVIEAQTTIPKTAHSEVTDAATAATCSKPGLSEGKHCSVCGAVTVKQITIPQKAHTYTDRYDATCNVCGFERDPDCAHTQTQTLAGFAATCTQSGLTEGKKCTKCEEILVAQEIIPIKDHTVVVDAAKASTCTQAGLTEGKHCSVCSAILVAQQPTPLKPHTEVVDPAVEHTYDSTGLTEGKHCSVCSTVLVPQQIIEKIPTIWHTITYYSDKTPGPWPKQQKYKEHEGIPYGELLSLSLEGYTFEGWFTDNGKKMEWIPPESTENYNLTAKWSLNKYKIHLGGKWKEETITYNVNEQVDLPIPVEDGLIFAGWRDAAGKVEEYTDSVGVRRWRIPKGTTGDIELVAQWKDRRNLIVPYNTAATQRYVNKGFDESSGYYWFLYELGEIQNVVLDEEKNLDKFPHTGGYITGELSLTESTTVEKSVAESTSHTVSQSLTNSFNWSEQESWESSETAGVSISFMVGAEAGPEFAKAKFETTVGTTYDATVSHGGGKGFGGSQDSTTETSDEVTSTFAYATSFSRATQRTIGFTNDVAPGNYYFANVGTVKVYAFVVYDPITNTVSLETISVLDEDTTTAVLSDKKADREYVSDSLAYDVDIPGIKGTIADCFFVQYVANNGATKDASIVKSYSRDTNVALASSLFSKVGYTSTKWKSQAGTVYEAGKTVKNLAASGQLITLHAQWDANKYTVKYNANKPSSASSSVQNVPGSVNCTYDTAFTLGSAPTLTGWTFGGWYTDPACQNKVGNAGQSVKNLTTENGGTVTLYAKWTENTYTVTFDANGGQTNPSSTSKKYESKYSSLPTPTRAGYAFIGWYYKSTQVTNGMSSVVDGNHTLVAKWTPTSGSWNNGLSDSNNVAIRNDGYECFLHTGLNREELKAAGYTKVSISGTIRGQRIYDWWAEDWYIEFYNRSGTSVHKDEIGKFSYDSFETRNIQYTLDIDCIRDDGTIKVRFDHCGGDNERGQYRIGLIQITSTAIQ